MNSVEYSYASVQNDITCVSLRSAEAFKDFNHSISGKERGTDDGKTVEMAKAFNWEP